MKSLLVVSGTVVVLAFAAALLAVVWSSSRRGLQRATLRKRELRMGKANTIEEYEPDKLTMTLTVESKPGHDTITINAEGPPDDVERVTGVLTDVLGPAVVDVHQPPRKAPRLRSEFTVVRRTNVEPKVIAQVDYAIPEHAFFQVESHHRTEQMDA